MKFSVFQASHKGGREKNEDRMGYCYTRDAALFMLADGMGGHPQGEVAAQLALQTLSTLFQRQARSVLADPAGFLTDALLAAHQCIFGYAQDRGLADAPRTTVVALLIQQSRATWIHCGDSRLYVVRAGELLLRTRDHSYAEHAGRAPRVPIHLNRNVLFTCIGSPVRPMYDLGEPLLLQRGDRLMLCSDGLWGSLPDVDIARELARQPVALSVPVLIDEALERGGAASDNVTAVALEWEAPGASPLSASTAPDMEDCLATPQSRRGDTQTHHLDEATIGCSADEIGEGDRRTAGRKG